MTGLALIAIQAEISMSALESRRAFSSFIDGLGERAAAAGADSEHRLFVFPEGIGFFLPLVLAPAAARRRKRIGDALAVMAMARPLSLLAGVVRARSLAPRAAVMSSVLPHTDDLMRAIFARVARRHRATVVAGSHHRLHADGRITNSSYTFDPDGHLVAITDKVNLVPTMEDSSPGGLGLSRGDPAMLPAVSTGWGKLATLICYDGFCRPHTPSERFSVMPPRCDAAGVDVIANPAANPWPWQGSWHLAPLGTRIARSEQWRAEGLPASLAQRARVRYGVTAHLCGEVLDRRFEGRSEILERREDGVRALARARSHDRAEVIAATVELPAGRNRAVPGPLGVQPPS